MQSGEPHGWYGYRWGQVRRSLLAQNSSLGSGAPRGHSRPMEGPRPHAGAPCTAVAPRGEGGTLCIPPSKDPGPGWTPLSLLCSAPRAPDAQPLPGPPAVPHLHA